jgi:Predicted membrane protein
MNISFEQICVLLVVGAIAGWLAGLILQRRGFGLLGNLILGVVGSFLGRFVVGLLGFGIHSTLAALITAVIGAILLLWLLSLLPRRKKK